MPEWLNGRVQDTRFAWPCWIGQQLEEGKIVKTNHFRGRRFSVPCVLLGVLAAAAIFGTTTSAASAAAKPVTVKYLGQPVALSRLNSFTQMPHGIQANVGFLACQGTSELRPLGPCPLHAPSDAGSPFGAASSVPHGHNSHFDVGIGGSLGSNFDGISDVGQRTTTGYHYTPPDQGLCVGPAGPLEGAGVSLGVPADQTVVVELVNDGWAVYGTDGTQLFLDSNINLFGDPYSSGDIECTYDSTTQTYFFTEIGALNGMYYGTNLAVLNDGGYSAYYVDTAEGGYCFPDFPHQGFDTNALYITINEFCGDSQTYAGSNVYAISKSQLVSHSAPNAVAWSLGSTYFGFRPALGAAKKEYLLASQQNDVTQNHLDVAWVTGDKKIATGGSPVTLSVTSIKSQSYSEPVDAVSTGDGTTCMQDFGGWCSIPEATLDPIDMRLEQVQLSKGLLYTSLTTSLTVGQDPTVVDGAAWFQVDPKKLKVTRQGYVGAASTYILDPSFVQSKTSKLGKADHFVMAFSMTGPTVNPSTGYMVSTNSGKWFSPISTTGIGSGPHVSFSDNQPDYNRKRWGDYSRIAIDPATGDVWAADEYIPSGPDGADTVDNWGTRVWQVHP